jgi:hypothetical protein
MPRLLEARVLVPLPTPLNAPECEEEEYEDPREDERVSRV